MKRLKALQNPPLTIRAWARLAFSSLLIAVISGLHGCADGTEPESSTPEAALSSEFRDAGIALAYTRTGQFQSITSTASAQATDGRRSSIEEATRVATLKARRQIAEFIKVTVESEQSVSSTKDTVEASHSSTAYFDEGVEEIVAIQVIDEIRQTSREILKGTYVAGSTYDPATGEVTVVVRAGAQESGIADQLSRPKTP